MHQKLFLILIVMSIGLFPATHASAAGENLISNPGFEVGRGNLPICWSFVIGARGNRFEWVCDDIHSGKKSLKMTSINPPSSGTSMGVFSNSFKAPAHSRVEVLLWMKANNVINRGDLGWFRLRVTLAAYNTSGDKIQHRDLLSEEGSFPWKKIRGGMIVPEGTDTMDLSIKLTTATGTVWMDDVEVKVVKEVPAVDLTGIYNPVLIPQPWEITYGSDKFQLEDIAIINQSEDGRIRQAIDSYFRSIDVAHDFFIDSDPETGNYSTRLILGYSKNPLLNNRLFLKFPNHSWSDLGEQGYFLAVDKGKAQNSIYIGANSDIGQFYAIQTLKQLIRDNTIYLVDIFDKPTVSCRGIPMGFHWFQQRTGETLKRLTELKFNFIWAQGSFLDDYTRTDNWRLPFLPSQKALISEFLELYRSNFINVWISMSPRGKNPPLQYSSDDDINTVVNKMDVLYTLGLRNFGLQFDDLENVGEDKLLVPEDIEFFNNNIGAAQVYFINEVYQRLRDIHPDIYFMVLPMNYSKVGNCGDKTEANLRLFRELPQEIRIYLVAHYDEDVIATTCLTGRHDMTIWSNFYGGWFSSPSEYVIPYLNFIHWQEPHIRTKLDGFTWLPEMPQREDAALVSWHTTADFAWAPERYEPNKSFQLAVVRYLGVPDSNYPDETSMALTDKSSHELGEVE